MCVCVCVHMEKRLPVGHVAPVLDLQEEGVSHKLCFYAFTPPLDSIVSLTRVRLWERNNCVQGRGKNIQCKFRYSFVSLGISSKR